MGLVAAEVALKLLDRTELRLAGGGASLEPVKHMVDVKWVGASARGGLGRGGLELGGPR
jgi:hypothetical protein